MSTLSFHSLNNSDAIKRLRKEVTALKHDTYMLKQAIELLRAEIKLNLNKYER